jgi:hypothetical protein
VGCVESKKSKTSKKFQKKVPKKKFNFAAAHVCQKLIEKKNSKKNKKFEKYPKISFFRTINFF